MSPDGLNNYRVGLTSLQMQSIVRQHKLKYPIFHEYMPIQVRVNIVEWVCRFDVFVGRRCRIRVGMMSRPIATIKIHPSKLFQSIWPKGLFKSFVNIKHNRTDGTVGDYLVHSEGELVFMEMRI